MTERVGGKSIEQAMAGLTDMAAGVSPIPKSDFEARLDRLQDGLRKQGARAAYLHAGTNLYYFTGLDWHPTERMVAAIVPAEGEISYVAPEFELDTLRDYWLIEAPIHSWQEHESPYELVRDVLASPRNTTPPVVLIDEVTPFFTFHGLREACSGIDFQHAQPLTQAFRSRKSSAELAIIRRAHEMTLAVIKAAASILRQGITTKEVETFIDEAHRAVGANDGSFFCIVLFGLPTSFPHGVKDPQTLQSGDWVLIDTGCLLHGYNSDLTRSFCFGEPSTEHRAAWNAEKAAQLAAFNAAQLGLPCEVCDGAARASLEAAGYGPGYQLPGLPHRTGHGCGLDIHEAPNLVKGEEEPLDVGMVFSSEPMLVLPGKFGVRLEDHFYMTENGPQWFTQPSQSIDDPFGE